MRHDKKTKNKNMHQDETAFLQFNKMKDEALLSNTVCVLSGTGDDKAVSNLKDTIDILGD